MFDTVMVFLIDFFGKNVILKNNLTVLINESMEDSWFILWNSYINVRTCESKEPLKFIAEDKPCLTCPIYIYIIR